MQQHKPVYIRAETIDYWQKIQSVRLIALSVTKKILCSSPSILKFWTVCHRKQAIWKTFWLFIDQILMSRWIILKIKIIIFCAKLKLHYKGTGFFRICAKLDNLAHHCHSGENQHFYWNQNIKSRWGQTLVLLELN